MFAVFLKIVALFLIVAAGFIMRRRGVCDDAFNRQLSSMLFNVFYPCLIANTILTKFGFGELVRLWTLPAGAGLIMILGWGIGMVLTTFARGWPSDTKRSARFLLTMNNYSFLPLMLVASLWGGRGEGLIVFASLGCELVMWTIGLQTLTGARVSWRSLRNLLSMPMIAMGLALAILALKSAGSVVVTPVTGAGSLAAEVAGASDEVAPSALGQIGEMLLYTLGLAGQATIPVSAVVSGLRMASMKPHHLWSLRMAAFAVVRLAVIPGIAILILHFIPLNTEVWRTLVVISTMPAAMACVPMAELYGGDREFAAAGVLISHIFCLVTIPFWLSVAGI